MRWLTFRVQKTPGFRLNIPDLLILAATAGLSAWLHRALPGFSLFAVPLYLVGTFFLFCNVFRFSNRLEALWYLPFAVGTALTLTLFGLTAFWWMVLLAAEPWKWVLVFHGMRQPTYIGVGHRRLAAWRAGSRTPA